MSPRTMPNPTGRSSPDGSQLPRSPNLRWVAAITGTVGTLLGLIVDLYSTEVRNALETTFARVVAEASTIAVAVFASCILTVAVCRRIFQQDQVARLTSGEINLPAGELADRVPDDDLVAGRQIRYLETRRPTDELVIYVHGLGLDASDFRACLNEGKYHAIALTLFGLNMDERDDARYRPVSLESHIEVLSYSIERLARQYPDKRLVLAGFSLGADLLMFLSERWISRREAAPRIHAMLLLDPNINRSTMNISSAIARMDSDRDLDELKLLIDETKEVNEFRNMCLYLHKIATKDLAQIRRFAQEILEYWDEVTYDQFISRIDATSKLTPRVRTFFSFHYERDLGSALRAARTRGIDPALMDATRCDHFELMAPDFVGQKLEELLR
jgi:pimeloyl-ACP methyl ester carboxylesterase